VKPVNQRKPVRRKLSGFCCHAPEWKKKKSNKARTKKGEASKRENFKKRIECREPEDKRIETNG